MLTYSMTHRRSWTVTFLIFSKKQRLCIFFTGHEISNIDTSGKRAIHCSVSEAGGGVVFVGSVIFCFSTVGLASFLTC